MNGVMTHLGREIGDAPPPGQLVQMTLTADNGSLDWPLSTTIQRADDFHLGDLFEQLDRIRDSKPDFGIGERESVR